MVAKIIDGKRIAAEVGQELKARVEALVSHGIMPGLGVVLVGDDPASVSYVNSKSKSCAELGIFEQTIRLPAEVAEDEVLTVVDRLNKDSRFHGILVQLPLPEHIDDSRVITAILPEKDVDCFHPINVGLLLIGKPYFLPCTPHGVWQLLLRSGYDVSGKHVVICGRSNLVGKPLAVILMQKQKGANATVTICHTGTRDLAHFTRQADILVAAAGSPGVIKADMVKNGAVVIDVGINRVRDPSKKSGFRLVGDVDFDAVKERVEAITPVPGGVGPMTVAMLLLNTVLAAEKKAGK